MRTRSDLLALVLSLTFAGAACDQTAANELAAARDDLNTARGELERAEALLTGARKDLEEARAELVQASAKSEALNALMARPSSAADPTVATDPTASTSPMVNAAAAIRCETPGQCTIDRTFLESLLEKPELLLRQVRIVPAVEAGKTLGMKLYAIRTGSLPKLLGLRNGDLVRAVNDLPLDTMEAAMSAYNKVRERDTLILQITRNDQPVSLTIRIVDGTKK
ncbi:MAG TPA: hypothetical protein ENJ18_18815 [Nannocystis exedens]|nr:hypothetical protein [Nannocystis exedens]